MEGIIQVSEVDSTTRPTKVLTLFQNPFFQTSDTFITKKIFFYEPTLTMESEKWKL